MLLYLSVVDHSTPLLLSPQWPCILYSLFALHSGELNFVCQWTRRTTRRGTRPWTASSTTRLSSTLTMKESSLFIIVQIIMIDYQDILLKIRAVLISNKKGRTILNSVLVGRDFKILNMFLRFCTSIIFKMQSILVWSFYTKIIFCRTSFD